jgi:hypothetical protein
MGQDEAVRVEPSPLLASTSEDLIVTPMPPCTTPAAEAVLHPHDARFAPVEALSFDPGALDDESFHFNSASFDADVNGIRHNHDVVVEPDLGSAIMNSNVTDRSQQAEMNPLSAIRAEVIGPDASNPLLSYHGVEQPSLEVSTLQAERTDANDRGRIDGSSLAEIDWAFDYQS